MASMWLKDFPAASGQVALPPMPGLQVWCSVDDQWVRAYAQSDAAPDDWTLLDPLQSIAGASAGVAPAFHYVVETDVTPEHDSELNAWYEQEHLPGLAAVPGTIRATRYRRACGSPRYLACYDLTSPHTLERPEWLAARHTEWSSRVRPLFRNTRRTMFRAAALPIALER